MISELDEFDVVDDGIDYLRMPDEVDEAELEFALQEDRDRRACPGWNVSRQKWLRNLFRQDPLARADIERKLNDPDPGVRGMAKNFEAERKAAEEIYCPNLNCLKRKEVPSEPRRGPKRRYCSTACANAAAQRKTRDEKNPNRGWRLRDLESIPAPRPGRMGNHRYTRKQSPFEGIQSIVTDELKQTVHELRVHSPTEPRIGEIIEAYLNGVTGWTRKHQKAKARSGSHRDRREEFLTQRGLPSEPTS